MNSLVSRSIWAVLVAELLCALAFSGAALLHEHHARLRAFDVMLEGRSDSLLGTIQDAEDPDDHVEINPAELRVSPEDVYAVYNRGGKLLGTSPGAPAALVERAADGFRERTADGHHYRLYQREAMRVIDRAEHPGGGLERPVTILYAAPTDHLWSESLAAASFYMLISLLLFAATAGLMAVLLPRLLQPIRDLAAQAAQVSLKTLHFDPPASALRLRELEPLALTLSSTVDGLRQALDQEHRFISDAAHELKTAVAVVRSTIQLQLMRPRSAEQYSAALKRLMLDNERVEALVAQMLQLARLEEVPQPDLASTDLAASARNAVHAIASIAQRLDITLHLELSPVQARVAADRAEVLISNLVLNAVQHSAPASGVFIRVSARNGSALLEVADQGSGISPAALPHLFERFFREDSSRSRNTGGAGLGLAIAKSIVDGAGGTIEVASEQGLGTRVSVIFRLA